MISPELLIGHKFYIDGEFERKAILPSEWEWGKLPTEPVEYQWQPVYGEVVSVQWDTQPMDSWWGDRGYAITGCTVEIVSDLTQNHFSVDVRRITNRKPRMK